jgi:hypothetical protein
MTRLARLAALLALAGCSADRHQETHYMTYTAAKIEGAVHKGWVPDWLPANANTLKEKHTPSSGQRILQFAFPPSDKWTPPASCARIPPASARRPALTAAWWPKDMPPAGYIVHACNGAREFLAVDFPRGEALYWQP